jgi:hypothetical protein
MNGRWQQQPQLNVTVVIVTIMLEVMLLMQAPPDSHALQTA